MDRNSPHPLPGAPPAATAPVVPVVSAQRPWQSVAIDDCGEPLEVIPAAEFIWTQPHPYQALGAPYGPGVTPFALRSGVLQALRLAQQHLQSIRPGWRFKVFDAYRPIAVQQFMVDHTFAELVARSGLDAETLSPQQRQSILMQVYQFWSPPSRDPADAPPHSTGSAIDVTLVSETDRDVDFGSPVDEVSVRSYPDRFADATSLAEQEFHRHRLLLRQSMLAAGFAPHPREWWHFSLGDRLWAWQKQQQDPAFAAIARYGRVDRLASVVGQASPDPRLESRG